LKRQFAKIKKTVYQCLYILSASLFVNLLLLATLPAIAQPYEKEPQENFIPTLIIIEGTMDSAEEVGLYLSQELVLNGFGVTVGITPYLNKKELIGSESLVKKLRELYDRYPEKISFALQGLEHLENELNKPLPEQIHIFSEAQSIFTQVFNKKRDDYRLLATTLLTPYGQYNPDIAATARQAGIKVVIGSEINGSQKGYTLLECDVVEIHPDSEVSMIADWQSLRIRTPEELIESMSGVLKESSRQDPLVIIINAGILYNQLGTEEAKRYIDSLVLLLDKVRVREKIEFITSAEFYRKFIGGKQYIILRIDDYQTPLKKELFGKVVDQITELGVPATIGIIPHAGARLSQDPEAIAYLNSRLEEGLIEVALHGYDHREVGEFTLSLSEQKQILRKALTESDEILYEDEIFSLIPSYNVSNQFTSKAIEAVNKEGYQVRVFSSGFGDKYMFGFDPEGIYHISRTIDVIKSWEAPYPLYSVEEILKAIGNDDAVLKIHPLRLEREEQQTLILEVIQRLKERSNVEFVTLRDFYFNMDPTLRLALASWRYFQRNTESSTGLVYSTVLMGDNEIYQHPITTIWDIASSLLGIVSAEKLGIISSEEGTHRISKILDFLQECELYQGKYPNFNYNVITGQMVKENPGVAWDDVGRMLAALKVIKTHYPSLEDKCNNVIERWDLTPLESLYQNNENERKLNDIKLSPYWNYVDASFRLWGYKDESPSFSTRLLDNMYSLFSQTKPDYYDRLLIPESYFLEAIEMGQTEKNKETLEKALDYQFGFYTEVYEEGEKINSSLSVNTNGIILESLWFDKRGKKPLVYLEELEVSPIRENIISNLGNLIRDFYSDILERLKIILENNSY